MLINILWPTEVMLICFQRKIWKYIGRCILSLTIKCYKLLYNEHIKLIIYTVQNIIGQNYKYTHIFISS